MSVPRAARVQPVPDLEARSAPSPSRSHAENPAGNAAQRMECRICWQVYDPALGDEMGQIAPGTAFEALPSDWRCPQCDAAKAAYLSCG